MKNAKKLITLLIAAVIFSALSICAEAAAYSELTLSGLVAGNAECTDLTVTFEAAKVEVRSYPVSLDGQTILIAKNVKIVDVKPGSKVTVKDSKTGDYSYVIGMAAVNNHYQMCALSADVVISSGKIEDWPFGKLYYTFIGERQPLAMVTLPTKTENYQVQIGPDGPVETPEKKKPEPVEKESESKPVSGQIIGQVLATDIRAYINGAEIPAYNIDGKLAIVVSDLNNYGFTTKYDNALRKTTVTRDMTKSSFTSVPSKADGKPIGTPVMNVLSSDIVVELDGKQIQAFNVDNRMAIYFSELKGFGDYGYDNDARASKLMLK